MTDHISQPAKATAEQLIQQEKNELYSMKPKHLLNNLVRILAKRDCC